MRLKHALLPLALLLSGCGAKAAEPPTMTVASVSDLASLFEGEFTTLPDAGMADAAPTSSAANPVLYNLAKRVAVPALGQDVVYAEQHENTATGPMLWQRLYAFQLDDELGIIVMKPYDFTNGKQLAGAYSDPTPLAKLDPAALKPQPDGCIVLWRRGEAGFVGTLKPGSCKDAPTAGAAASQNASGIPAITVTQASYTEQPPGGSAIPIVFRRIH